MSAAPNTLPPLPGSTSAFSLTGSIYTADDMREYARVAIAAQSDEIAELKEAYALLFKANAELRALLDRPQVLHECLDNPMPPMKCRKHLIQYCKQCKETARKPKPHGPVSEHLMRHWYGAKR